MATAFPQTLGPQQAPVQVPNAPTSDFTLPQYSDPYAAQIAALQARIAQPAKPMYSPEQIAQRKTDNENQYNLGILGQLSGDQTAGEVGASVFKQALANRQPKYTDHGIYDPQSGQFSYSPEYVDQRNQNQLMGVQEQSAQSRAAYDRMVDRMLEQRETQRLHNETMLMMKGMGAANGQIGNYQPAGVLGNGHTVVTNTKDGMTYEVTQGADGKPVYKLSFEPFTPRATFDKDTEKATDLLGSADRAGQISDLVRKNSKAFGVMGSLVGSLSGRLQPLAGKALGLTPDQLNARAQVMRDAAMELHTIYGAAQSEGELARAASWAPLGTDDFETTLNKLDAARQWATSKASQLGPAVVRAARSRTGHVQQDDGSWKPSADAAGAPGAAASAAGRSKRDPYGLLGGQ
jgi:hypothetical protein